MPAHLTFTAQARRVQIVRAAVRVLARDGLSKASFGRIAAQAGLSSPGMISYHFANKDELLTVLADSVVADCLGAIDEAVAAVAGPEQALAAYITGFVNWQDAHPEDVAALWRLSSGWKRPGQEWAFDEALLRAPVLRILEAGQQAGALRPAPAGPIAHAVVAAVESYQQARYDDPELDAETFAGALVDLFGDGLRA